MLSVDVAAVSDRLFDERKIFNRDERRHVVALALQNETFLVGLTLTNGGCQASLGAYAFDMSTLRLTAMNTKPIGITTYRAKKSRSMAFKDGRGAIN
jgi:hypothetical protein